MARRLARGEIWMYEFRTPDKVRPVLILSRSDAIEHLHSVIVAPITTTIRGLRSEVLVGETEGLKTPSAVNLDHVQSVEQAKIRRFVGTLSAKRMKEICRALSVATGCDEG